MDNTHRKEIVIEIRIPESEFKDWRGNDDEKVYEMKSDLKCALDNNFVRDFKIHGEMRQY